MGQLNFEWYNQDKQSLERIDFKTGHYELIPVNKGKGLYVKNKLIFEGINETDILPNYHVNLFTKGNYRLISVPGTGQVYELNSSNTLLKRIDKTFYRGYNFKAVQFIHRDTLFSLGGTGFWQYHSVLSYFNPSTKDWQLKSTLGNRPEGVYANMGGVANGRVYVFEKQREVDNLEEGNSMQILEYNIQSNTWATIGELNDNLLSSYKINSPEFQLSSNHMFFLNSSSPIFANILTNNVYQYNETSEGILSNKGLNYIANGWVYTLRDEHHKITLDSISYEELIRNSKVLGQLYSPTKGIWSSKNNLIITFSIFILIFVGIAVYYKSKGSLEMNAPTSSKAHPKYFSDLLSLYASNGPNYLVSTDELSSILECDSMAFDTQRQYRSKFITSVNAYVFENYGIADSIFRQKQAFDKRIIQYGIKHDLFELIPTILI